MTPVFGISTLIHLAIIAAIKLARLCVGKK